MPKRERIFFWSDPHSPIIHEDTYRFCKALTKKYGPWDKVICLGDEFDHHAISFHEHHPDLPSAGDEIKLAIEQIEPFFDLFPNVVVLESNHGSLPERRAVDAGLSLKLLRSKREQIGAPRGWDWAREHKFRLRSNGQWIYAVHGLKSNGLTLAKELGMSVCQGHYHSVFSLQYTANPHSLHWSMQVGCSFNQHHPAASYALLRSGRPIVGQGAVIDGFPRLLPMTLKRRHRWNGEVP